MGFKLSYAHQWGLKLKESGRHYFRLAIAAEGQHNIWGGGMTPEIRVQEWELIIIIFESASALTHMIMKINLWSVIELSFESLECTTMD